MYQSIAKNIEKFTLVLPTTIVPIPADSDYELGFIYRYFVRKANDENAFIFEIAKDDFKNYSTNPFWVVHRIKWRIAGPLNAIYKKNGELQDKGVFASNKSAIAIATSTLKNISLYLPNLSQLYKG